jgi:hypothetical protein
MKKCDEALPRCDEAPRYVMYPRRAVHQLGGTGLTP